MNPDLTYIVLRKIYMALYVFVVIVALWNFNKYKNTNLRYFPLVLIFTMITEYAGLFILDYLLPINTFIYNVYYIIFYLFLFYLYHQTLKTKRFKKWIQYCSLAFILVAFINPFYFSFITENHFVTYITGAVFIIFSIVLFFIEILNSEKVILVKSNLLFWISVGMLIFFVGYIPIKLIRTIFEGEASMYMGFRILHAVLIIIMNLCFTVGFLTVKRKS